jgi:hypothetical protein
VVEQDDADVGPEAFTVEHNQPRILVSWGQSYSRCSISKARKVWLDPGRVDHFVRSVPRNAMVEAIIASESTLGLVLAYPHYF